MTRITYSQLEDILKEVFRVTYYSDGKTSVMFYVFGGLCSYEATKFDTEERKITFKHRISGEPGTIWLDDYPCIFIDDYAIYLCSDDEYDRYKRGLHMQWHRLTFHRKASMKEVMEYCNNLSTTESNN